MEKKKKSQSYKESRLDQLSKEEIAKIAKFAKEYITKMLYKMKPQHGPDGPPSSTSPAFIDIDGALVMPNSADRVDVAMADITMEDHPEMDDGSDLGSDGERGEGRGRIEESKQSFPSHACFSGSGEPTDSSTNETLFYKRCQVFGYLVDDAVENL